MPRLPICNPSQPTHLSSTPPPLKSYHAFLPSTLKHPTPCKGQDCVKTAEHTRSFGSVMELWPSDSFNQNTRPRSTDQLGARGVGCTRTEDAQSLPELWRSPTLGTSTILPKTTWFRSGLGVELVQLMQLWRGQRVNKGRSPHCFVFVPRHDPSGTAIGLPISWGGAGGVNGAAYMAYMGCLG